MEPQPELVPELEPELEAALAIETEAALATELEPEPAQRAGAGDVSASAVSAAAG